MSRSWAETWRIGLAPEGAEVLHVPRWSTQADAPAVRARCAPAAASSLEPGWLAALDAMDQALAEAGAEDAAAVVVLSNHFARFLMIPWQPEVNRQRELEEVATLRMKQVFGDGAAAWTIRCSEGGYGEPSLACAVDSDLIAALKDRLGARRLRLRSLQPLLMAAGNDLRRQFGRDQAFALAESGRVCVGMLRDGAVHAVASRRAGANPASVALQELSAFGWEPERGDLAVLRIGENVPSWPDDERFIARHLDAGPRSLAACGMA